MSWGFELIDVHAEVPGCARLRGVSLGARRGELTMLAGATGAGKTAVFRLLAGLAEPREGAVLVAGRDIGRLRGRARAKVQRRMAVVFDGGHALFEEATAMENVAFAMRAAGRVPRRRVDAEAAAELERFGLGGCGAARPGELRADARKCLALARALALRAPLVLVDDLDAGLDPAQARRIGGVLREEAHRHGATVLATTGDVDLACELGDDVAGLTRGRSASLTLV
jgi:phospholipid/cholesterol/gamma-HCH transport system ATP-binding protein